MRSLSRTPPIAGSNVILSLDIGLQKLVEELFGNRRGALVAIEPATGDVLAFVSKPTFDPNLFVDGIDPQSWQALNEDPDKPLLNRPLRGTYPPGSTYKPFMALAALTTGARRPDTAISDPGYFQLGSHRFRDSVPGGHGSVNLHKSIVVSSDTYYYKLAYDMGVDAIHDFMAPWKFGQLTGIDLENEVTGILPSSDWKTRRYKLKWLPGETPSIGIGQGYNAFTILQLAHATATLANDGVVMRPHLVKSIENPVTRERGRCGARAQLPDRPEARAPRAGEVRDGRREPVRHQPAGVRGRRIRRRRQDRHRAGDRHQAGREVRHPAHRRAAPRPFAVHGLRAGGPAAHRAGRDRRERRLRRTGRGADRAQGVRLRAAGQAAERSAGGARGTGTRRGAGARAERRRARRAGRASSRNRSPRRRRAAQSQSQTQSHRTTSPRSGSASSRMSRSWTRPCR